MLYEIVNPSDPYTIEAESLDVAFIACVLLGEGQYAFDPIKEGEERIPIFLFGGASDWCLDRFKESVQDVHNRVMRDKSKELAECLDSCLIGNVKNRETYLTGLRLIDDPAKREQWRAKWHDNRRSSMNNIGARAYAMAKRIRGQKVEVHGAPRQVFST